MGGQMHPTIFVVDDNADLRDALCEFFKSEGYGVGAAATGRDALDQLRSGLSVSIILLDLMMPDMTGFQFRLEQLRHPEIADIPLVAHSGIEDVAFYAQRLNAKAYIRKPAPMDHILAVVREHCRK